MDRPGEVGGLLFALGIPAQADYLVTARLFVAVVARSAGCGEETVEDAKVAVSEACTDAIRRAAAGPIRVAVATDDGAAWVEVRDRGRPPVESMDEGMDALGGMGLVEALFDDAVRRHVESETIVRFSLVTPGLADAEP